MLYKRARMTLISRLFTAGIAQVVELVDTHV